MTTAPPLTRDVARPAGQQALERALAWQRVRRCVLVALLLLTLVALITADRFGLLLYAGSDWSRYHQQTFTVTHVVDGDTLDLASRDGRREFTRVRLWGVDCPEIAKPFKHLPAQPLGDEATAYTRSLVEKQNVRVELQAHRVRDRYGRLLAYVWLPDGTLLNQRLLEQGLARADERWSHDKLEVMLQHQSAARDAKRGIWSLTPKQRRGSGSTAMHELQPAGHDGDATDAAE